MTSPFLFDGDDVGDGSRTWENVFNFSTPDREVWGGTLGNANCCNNTRRILERADAVRNITTETQMTAGMLAPGYINCYCDFFAEPIINCGVAPFTTRWEIWINGGSFTTEFLSNDERFYFSTNPEDYPYGSTAEIRLQITSSDGQVVNVSHFMPVWATNYPQQVSNGNQVSNENVVSEPTTEQTILPNPVSDRFIFNYSVKEPSKNQFLLLNNQGTIVINREANNEKGTCSQAFDVSNMPSGNYLLKARINKETVIKKITITH